MQLAKGPGPLGTDGARSPRRLPEGPDHASLGPPLPLPSPTYFQPLFLLLLSPLSPFLPFFSISFHLSLLTLLISVLCISLTVFQQCLYSLILLISYSFLAFIFLSLFFCRSLGAHISSPVS